MDYRVKKQKLIERLDNLHSIVSALEDENIVSEVLRLKEELESELKFKVLCTGEFSAGKSTFINNFFIKKEGILPTAATETTAKLTYIEYGEKERIEIYYINKENPDIIEKLEKDVLENFLAKDGVKVNNVNYVKVYINSEALKEGISIIDSPGLNSPENERVELTKNFVPKADAVLYVMSALQPWKATEKDFLENKILNREDLDKIFFLVNFWDQIEEKERDEVLNFIKEEMKKSLEIAKRDLGGNLPEPPIIPISAKTKFNFDKLEKELITYLSSKKGEDILNNKGNKLESIKKQILKNIDEKIKSYEKDKTDLQRELELIKEEISKLEEERENHKKEIEQDISRKVDEFISELKNLYDKFQENIKSFLENRLDINYMKVNNIRNTEDWIKKVDKKIAEESKKLDNNIEDAFKKFYKEVERFIRKRKAALNLEDYIIKDSLDIKDFQRITQDSLGKDIIKDESNKKEGKALSAIAGVGSGVGALIAFSINPFIGVLSLIGGSAYMLYYNKEKDAMMKKTIEFNKNIIEENVQKFCEDLEKELKYKRQDLVDKLVDNIELEIEKTYKEKEKRYKEVLNNQSIKEKEVKKLLNIKEKIEKIGKV